MEKTNHKIHVVGNDLADPFLNKLSENAQALEEGSKEIGQLSLKVFDEMKFNTEVTRPIHYKTKLPGRNEPCQCGSGRKYKRCCYFKDHDGKAAHIYVKHK